MKRITISIILMAVSLLASAQTGTPIESLPYIISSNGDYYLEKDLSSAATSGTLISVAEGITAKLDLNGKTITSTAANPIIISNAGTLEILDSSDNHAGTIDGKGKSTTEGRGIYNTGTLTIYGGKIYNCKANGGGGIANSGGTLTIDGEYFIIDNCTSGGSNRTGGGIYNINNGKVYFRKGTISNCSSKYSSGETSYGYGGGIVNGVGCRLEISGGLIVGCTSLLDGGGIWNKGTMIMTGGEIRECSATGNGGGIANVAEMTISKGTIKSCKASNDGGGIFVDGSSGITTINPSSVSDVIIDGNSNIGTAGWGGGICVSGGGRIEITNVTITNNTSSYYGGGIALNGSTSVITGGYIAHNTSYKLGGGIHSGASSHSDIGDPDGDNSKLIIEDNHVTKADADDSNSQGGGGISVGFVGNKNYMRVYACTIRNNTSNRDGGGILLRTVSGAGNDVGIEGGIISGNTSGRNGGGFYTNGVVSITGGSFINNSAVNNGGGVYMNGANNFSMTGGTIDGNHAGNDGGGVWAGTSGVNVTITGGKFINNTTDTNGGGFYAAGTVSISGDKVEIKSNTAVKNGGGFYIASGKTTISGGAVLSSNTADIGGAAYLKGECKLLDQNTKINNNIARLGGALYLSSGNSTVSAGSIQSNSASEYGGAIYADGGTLTIEGSEISLNNATINGGGIFNDGSVVTMTNGVISYNNAVDGAGFYNNQNISSKIALTCSGGSISHNKATGNGAGLYINAGTIKYTGGELSGNTASQDGGGVYINAGTMNIYGGKINGNAANRNGGGVYANGGTVKFEKDSGSTEYGTISGNAARNGGGIYILSAANMTFNYGLITGNRAISSGAAIHTAYQSDPVLAGSDISGVGGGVYVGKGTSSTKVSKLTFASSSSLGVYLNTADNGADDVFADGQYTSITLPTASKMVVIGMAGKAKGWFADYVTGDTYYNQGLFSSGSGVRYRSNPETALEYTPGTSAITKYVCLTLGIDLAYLTIQKEGLKNGESALFTLTHSSDKRQVILTGIDNKGSMVSAKLTNLELGTWTVTEETGWSWTYSTAESSKMVELTNEESKTVTFTNTKEAGKPSNAEAVKNNKLNSNGGSINSMSNIETTW